MYEVRRDNDSGGHVCPPSTPRRSSEKGHSPPKSRGCANSLPLQLTGATRHHKHPAALYLFQAEVDIRWKSGG